ncbi:MAG: VOC family protein [Deltaproteobacteria bacterium]|nr:VOC family protein [Deltaproteobacteria bacterium]
MLSHCSLGVSDLDASLAFYDALLAPLGVVRVWTYEKGAGYGAPGGPDKLAIFLAEPSDRPLAAGPGFHLALSAPNAESVHSAHAAGLSHGGSDEGPPGPRPRYGSDYYAAFLRDPDGHKLELKVMGPS